MPNVPANGWFAIVTNPSNGHTHAAPIIEGQGVEPQPNSQANARPSIRLPVRKDDKWQAILGDGSSDIDLDVWHDGLRQPIDTLVNVEQTEGVSVLVGEGGRELKTRVEASFDQKAVHTAAQDLIDNNTTYTSNVDTPSTTTETNTTLITLTSNSDWLTRTNFLDTDPLVVESGTLKLAQTNFLTEGEDYDRNSGTTTVDASRFSGDGTSSGDGRAEELTAEGDFVEYEFTPDHTIPADDFELWVRHDENNTPAIDITVNGVTWEGVNDGGTFTAPEWNDLADPTTTSPTVTGGYKGGDFAAGETYTVRFEATTSGGTTPRQQLDVIAPLDSGDRLGGFSYNFDDTLETNNNNNRAFDGPELFPNEVQVGFDIVVAPLAVTGARAEATISTGASDFTHHLSNDQGANFTTGTGANFETDSLGASWGPGVTYEAGLSRTGTQEPTPQEGINGTDLESLTLKADLEDMPLVVNRTFDGHLDGILAELAQIGDSLWEFDIVGTGSGGYEVTPYGTVGYGTAVAPTEDTSIEWTRPGQRTTTQDPGINAFRATKTVGEVFQKAIVYGQPDTPVRGERLESDHGTAVSLHHTRIQQGSERVEDPDTGQRFRQGSDYTLDFQKGEITVLAAGDMANGEVFEIDYNYQAFGEYDDGTADPNVTDRIDLPGLWTDFLCKQAARLIVEEVNTPIHTSEVTLPNDSTDWSVVESLDPDIVPTGGNALHVKTVENTPQATVLTLGSRRSVSDVVGDIRAQVGAVSRKA